MLTSIIFMVALVATISGCLIYSERLYVHEFKLKGMLWLIISLLDMAAVVQFVNRPYWFLALCGLFPLLYLVGDIASAFKIPHAKIPRYNWGAWFLIGIAVLVFYWALGGDLPSL